MVDDVVIALCMLVPPGLSLSLCVAFGRSGAATSCIIAMALDGAVLYYLFGQNVGELVKQISEFPYPQST